MSNDKPLTKCARCEKYTNPIRHHSDRCTQANDRNTTEVCVCRGVLKCEFCGWKVRV